MKTTTAHVHALARIAAPAIAPATIPAVAKFPAEGDNKISIPVAFGLTLSIRTMNNTALDTESLWSEFSSGIYALIKGRVQDAALAQDLLQEVFIKVHLALPSLREDASIGPWLNRIALNVVTDHFRARKSVSTVEAPESESESKQLQALEQCMLPMLQSLPAEYRQAVLLADVKGEKQQAVAEQLGLSLSGAKSRIQRGRQMMRQNLADCCQVYLSEGGVIRGEHDPESCSKC